MSGLTTSKARLFLLIGFLVLLHLGISGMIAMTDPDSTVYGDDANIIIGRNIAQGSGYSMVSAGEPGQLSPTFWKPPVAPFIFATGFSLFDNERITFELFRALQVLLNIGIALIAGGLCLKLGYGFFPGATLALLDSNMLFYANRYAFPDTLMSFLVALSLFFILSSSEKKQPGLLTIIVASFLCGIAGLTEAVSHLLFVPLSIAIFFVYINSGLTKSNSIRLAILFILLPALLIGGWSVRNGLTTGYFSFSSQEGNVFLYSNARYLLAHQNSTSHREAKRQLREKYSLAQQQVCYSEGSLNEYHKKIAMKYIVNSPINYLLVVLKRIPNILLPSPAPEKFMFPATKRTISIVRQALPQNRQQGPHVVKKLFEQGMISLAVTWGGMWAFQKIHLAILYLLFPIGMITAFVNGGSERSLSILGAALIGYYCLIASPASQEWYRAPFMLMVYVFAVGGGRYFLGQFRR